MSHPALNCYFCDMPDPECDCSTYGGPSLSPSAPAVASGTLSKGQGSADAAGGESTLIQDGTCS